MYSDCPPFYFFFLSLLINIFTSAQGDLRQVQVACENLAGSGNTVITCPAGTYVYIANAFWGRRDTSTCAAPGAAGLPTDASTLCMGAGTTLYPAIAAACNTAPSSTCIVSEPSIDVLGTPSQLNGQSVESESRPSDRYNKSQYIVFSRVSLSPFRSVRQYSQVLGNHLLLRHQQLQWPKLVWRQWL